MAKVTLNSDKEEDVFKTFGSMGIGELGQIVDGVFSGTLIVKKKGGSIIDLSDFCELVRNVNFNVRILRSDESVTLRNE